MGSGARGGILFPFSFNDKVHLGYPNFISIIEAEKNPVRLLLNL